MRDAVFVWKPWHRWTLPACTSLPVGICRNCVFKLKAADASTKALVNAQHHIWRKQNALDCQQRGQIEVRSMVHQLLRPLTLLRICVHWVVYTCAIGISLLQSPAPFWQMFWIPGTQKDIHNSQFRKKNSEKLNWKDFACTRGGLRQIGIWERPLQSDSLQMWPAPCNKRLTWRTYVRVLHRQTNLRLIRDWFVCHFIIRGLSSCVLDDELITCCAPAHASPSTSASRSIQKVTQGETLQIRRILKDHADLTLERSMWFP